RCASALAKTFARRFEGYILASPDTQKLREKNYPLDDILANDRAAKLLIISLQDVAVKVKYSNMMRRSTYSHSAPAVWQIQLEQVSSGKPVTWGSLVRFRHVASTRYLCVEKNPYTGATCVLELGTTSTRSRSVTLFTVQSLGAEPTSHALAKDTFFFLKHEESGLYVVLAAAEDDFELQDADGASNYSGKSSPRAGAPH
ncbi:MAG: hypothetical protein SGPRY_003120, partial [Prymnesium sp.]